MKLLRFRLLALGAALILAAASCGTTPPPEQPATPPPSPEAPAPEPDPVLAPDPAPDLPGEESLASLAALRARAEAARNDALAFDGPVYFKDETAAVDDEYNSAKAETGEETAEQVEDAIDRYTRIVEAFEKILEDSLPLYARDRMDEVIAARNAAVSEGAPNLMPERFLSAEDAAEEARKLYEEEGDYRRAAAAVPLVIGRYNALALGVRAYRTRERIEFYSFERYDPENFAQTDDLALSALNAYDSGDIDTALDAAAGCFSRYTAILNTGMRAYALERRTAADTGRRSSVQSKAPVAVKDDFALAQGIFDSAEKLFRGEQYIEAAELYFRAEFAFAEVTAIAEQKRILAEEAIRRAEESVAASENTARTAEEL